jgi:ATP-dependent DNA helicase RecG
MHRDYQSNMPIRLYQFDDYIEVMNAGGLYGDARPENFPSVNDYRNPLIAEAMRVMKYVNKFNRGIIRVQEMLKYNGNPQAEFDINAITAFRVNVHSIKESDISTPISQGTSQGTSHTEKTVEEKIIEFCKEPRSLAEITDYCGLHNKRKFRERYLNPLLDTRIQMTIPDKPTSRFQKYKTIK